MPQIRRWPCLVLMFSTPIALGATIHVDASAVGGANDGSSWSDAFRGRLGLMAALAVAQPGDEIWIANGEYAPAGPGGPRTVSFVVPTDVALLGGFAGGEASAEQRDPALHIAVLTGDLASDDGPPSDQGYPPHGLDNSQCVVRLLHAGDALLDGLTIRGGVSDLGFLPVEDSGGNLFIRGGAPTIRRCVIERGYAGWTGGGVAMLETGVSFEECVFRGNRADWRGSGAAVMDEAVAVFTDCVFDANFCGQGAGAYIGVVSFNDQTSIPGDATFVRCTFQDAQGIISSPSGGGIFAHRGSVTALDCSFTNNVVVGGGGACYLSADSVLIDRCNFVGNFGQGDGGGAIYIDGGLFRSTAPRGRFIGNNGALLCGFSGNVHLINCTVANNSLGLGASVWPAMLVADDSVVTLSNTVVWGNFNELDFGTGNNVLVGFGTYTLQRCIVQDLTPSLGGDAIDADPLLRDADGPYNVIGTVDDDVRLRFGSPAIDTGIDALVPPTSTLDFDGRARFIDADAQSGPIVDLGAYEHPCAPDINADGLVNFSDLNGLLGLFGQSVSGPEDINADGVVGFADLNILLSAFGVGC
jgi:hypothetical protein